MVTLAEIYALAKTYPVIAIIIAIILVFLGFKVTTRLFRWILWIIGAIILIGAVIYLFFF